MSNTTEAADELRELDDASRKASEALDEGTKAAKALEEKLSKLGELTIRAGLGGEVAEKFQHIKKAFDLAGDSSLGMGQRAVAGAAGIKMLGGTVLGVASGIVDFARDVTQASARVYEYDLRVRALGDAHRAMQGATAGNTDVTAAFMLQQALADRGIEQSAETMAVLARAIREHANARGTSQQEATQVVLRAIDGESTAAAQYGLRLQGVSAIAGRHAAALQQMAAAQRGVSVEQTNAAEHARAQELSLSRAADGYKNVIANSWGMRVLTGYVEAGSAALARLGVSSGQATAEEQRRAAALRQTTSDQQRAQAIQDRAAADATRALREQRQQLLAQLVDQRDSSGVTRQLAEAQQEYADALRRTRDASQTTGLRGDDLERRRIALLQDEMQKRERLNQLRGQADQARSAERDVGWLAAQARSRGMIVGLEVQSIPLRQRLNELLSEAANLTRREGETLEQFHARSQAKLQEANAARDEAIQRARAAQEERAVRNELRVAQQESISLEGKAIVVSRLAGETRTDWMRRQLEAYTEANRRATELARTEKEHVQAQHDLEMSGEWLRRAQEAEARLSEGTDEEVRRRTEALRSLEQQLHDLTAQGSVATSRLTRSTTDALAAGALTTDAVLERIAERYREIEAITSRGEDRNLAGQRRIAQLTAEAQALGQVRDEYTRTGSVVEQLRGQFEGLTNIRTAGQAAGEALSGTIDFAKGLTGALLEASAAGEDAGGALAKYVDEWLGAKAVQWGSQAVESFAGAGLAYFIRPDAVPGLLAAGAAYSGLAVAAGIATAAIPNAPSGGAGGGGGAGAGGERMASARGPSSGGGSSGPAQITIHISSLTPSGPETTAAITRAVNQGNRYGVGATPTRAIPRSV